MFLLIVRMKLFILIILFQLFVIVSFADNYPTGARNAGMANTGVMFSDFWSIQHNQAGLGFAENFEVGIYSENSFLVKELTLNSGALVYPSKLGVFGLSLTHFGYSQYNESKIGFAYSKKLSEKFSVGIQFDYLNTHFSEEYGNKSTMAVEIGILAKPIEKLSIGAHVFNPTQSEIAEYDNEKIPTIFSVGMGYTFTEKVVLAIETEKDILEPMIFKTGIEYQVVDNLFLRAGISTNPIKNSFGLGYKMKNFTADISFSTHQSLGMTPHVSLMYTL